MQKLVRWVLPCMSCAFALSAAFACSGTSDSTIQPGAEAGTPPTTEGGPGPADGFAPPEGDSGVILDDGGTNCTEVKHATMATHIRLNVSWDGTGVLTQGSGVADIWTLTAYDVNGNALTGKSHTCGISLPGVQLTFLAGNRKIALGFEDHWDAPSMPKFDVTGTQSGYTVGSTHSTDPTLATLGIASTSSFANKDTAWPATGGTYPQFPPQDLNDDDGVDGAGVTLVPSTANGNSLIPTSADFINNPVADKVFIASRNTVALKGKYDTCTQLSGTAEVAVFENHVVGCHDSTGDNCANSKTGTNAGPGFVDTNRTVFKPGTATFISRRVVDTATCAQARAAVP